MNYAEIIETLYDMLETQKEVTSDCEKNGYKFKSFFYLNENKGIDLSIIVNQKEKKLLKNIQLFVIKKDKNAEDVVEELIGKVCKDYRTKKLFENLVETLPNTCYENKSIKNKKI